MNALRLAFNLLRIPRLFASLLLFPLILGLLLVYAQLVLTGVVLNAVERRNPAQMQSKLERRRVFHVGRFLLFGDGGERPAARVCRWVQMIDRDGVPFEAPPSEECAPDRLDVALRVREPATFDARQYEGVFQGATDRLHLCRECQPDIVIDLRGEERRTEVSSVWGMLVLSLLGESPQANTQMLQALREFEAMQNMLGSVSLHLPGFEEPIELRRAGGRVAIIFNSAGLILIALWLALKAHRRVLEYLSGSGALLPMVAATGKTSFYGAIWILTATRVGAFLLAAVPLTLSALVELGKGEALRRVFGGSTLILLLWIAAMGAALSLATLVGSISELKQRHAVTSVLYRWVPLVLCGFGATLWSLSFLLDGSNAAFLRAMVAVVPVVGTVPIVLAPIFRPEVGVLFVHFVLSVLGFMVAMHTNARWFAAHVEEL